MRTQLFIDGTWRDGSTGATIAVTDPATGEHLADVAAGTAADATAACDAAHAAQLFTCFAGLEEFAGHWVIHGFRLPHQT